MDKAIDLATEARKAVLRQLADAYERHAELEQALVTKGRYDEAAAAHEIAVKVLRAYEAESRPEGRQ